MESFNEILYNLPLLAAIAGLISFVLSTRFNLYPVIVYISEKKRLVDNPDDRMSHAKKIPNLGGMGIFITFTLVMLLFVSVLRISVYDLSSLLSITAALIILLFLGVKDDLVLISPKKKLLIQIIAVSMVCVLEDVRITDFHGLFGITELPYVVSVAFSMFFFVLMINAFNLIDGIDGLAASIAILASLCLGVFFLSVGYYMMSLLSATLIGSLFGFLKYNLSKNMKIFMGDCGSMVIGFLVAYQGTVFLDIHMSSIINYNTSNSPIFLMAILSFPLFDLIRVSIVRISKGKSPFEADNNHIHHRLLKLGLTHKQATLLLVASNFVLIVLTYFTINLSIHSSLLVLVAFSSLLYLVPFLGVFEEYKPVISNIENVKQKTGVEDRTITKGILELENYVPIMEMEKNQVQFASASKELEPESITPKAQEVFISKRNEKFKHLLSKEMDKKVKRKKVDIES